MVRLKRKLKNHLRYGFLILNVAACSVSAQQVTEEEPLFDYGDKPLIATVTGGPLPIQRAPAVASVITAQDIKAIGAKNLDQVLKNVPGLHVSVSPFINTPIYSFRGIYTNYNPQVLVLMNGVPMTETFAGNRSFSWADFPLEYVTRIEVIRGPGSALYGADAYAGVINILTKTANDIDGTEYGMRFGSNEDRHAWIQRAVDMDDIKAAFYFGVTHSDGYQGLIEKDAQSALDSVFGTHASLAPGSVNARYDGFDLHADVAYKEWRLRAFYQDREVGTGGGVAQSLDPGITISGPKFLTDLNWQSADLFKDWDISTTLSYSNLKMRVSNPYNRLYPRGAFNNTFPDGVIGNPGHAEQHVDASLSGFYSGLSGHRIRLGMGYRLDDMYQTSETKNFNIVALPNVGPTFVPLGSVMDVSNDPTLVFLQPHKRNVWYVFAQDEWSITKDLALTTGLRNDRYSDFGSTTNPRIALVWDAAYNVVWKLMHGRAFRAPSFIEQYNINNPVNIGNPNVRPETITTDELALFWQPLAPLQLNLSLFKYHMRDILRYVPNADPATGATAQNAGDQTGRGFELEAAWDITRVLRLTTSYSYQQSIDQRTGQDAGLAPHRRIFSRADWRFAPSWQFGSMVNYVADRKREPGDLRPPVADYTTVDLTLRREKLWDHWEVRTTVQNLFNRNAKEPTFAPGSIPFDYPLPGRTFLIEFQHTW